MQRAFFICNKSMQQEFYQSFHNGLHVGSIRKWKWLNKEVFSFARWKATELAVLQNVTYGRTCAGPVKEEVVKSSEFRLLKC